MKSLQAQNIQGNINKESFILISLIFILAIVSCMVIYTKKYNGPPIRSDGFGYYSYLPSLFIDHDLSFKTPIENLQPTTPPRTYGLNVFQETSRYINKYTIGTAVLELPSYLIATAITKVLQLDNNGYSPTFQYANTLSAIIYFCIGLLIIYRQLRKRFTLFISVASLLLLVFGTNLFHYSTYDASFSHVYSFATFSVLLYYLLKYQEDENKSHSLKISFILGLTVGMIGLLRVPNVTVALIPAVLFMASYQKNRNFAMLVKESALFLLAATLVFSLQMMCWKYATGHFFVNSYLDETFNWSNPQFVNFLFSVQKGLFFWAPSLFIAVLGLVLLIKKEFIMGLAISAFMLINIYVCSSWWAWSYGHGFGSRPFVDVLPLLAIPLALGTQYIANKIGTRTVALQYLALMVWSCTLMISYWRRLIPGDGTSLETFKQLIIRFLDF